MSGGRKQSGYVGRKPEKTHKHEVWPGVQVGPDARIDMNTIKSVKADRIKKGLS